MESLKRKLQKKEEEKKKNKEQLKRNIERIYMKCEEFIFDLQNEQKNLNQRKKELNEFRKFVDLYINPKYKEKLVLFIERIAEQIAAQERKEYDLERTVDEERLNEVEWQANCFHIGLAYNVWAKNGGTRMQLIEKRKRLEDYYNKNSLNYIKREEPQPSKLGSWKVIKPQIAELGITESFTENKPLLRDQMDKQRIESNMWEEDEERKKDLM